MLLTIKTTHTPATDIGYLLHKNPGRVHQFDLTFGRALVFYPVAQEDVCEVSLLLEVDPIAMVRNRRGASFDSGALATYVNDRPYTANSFMSVAIAEAFGTALNARCNQRPELVDVQFPLEITLPVLPVTGGQEMLEQLFAPLGYAVESKRLPLDENFPEWGESKYYEVKLTGTQRVADALGHLYVLIPVLDNSKHYYVGEDELAKLLKRGEGWLAGHPEKDRIVARYLRRRRPLIEEALQRLSEEEGDAVADGDDDRVQVEEAADEKIGLHDQRIAAVKDAVARLQPKRLLDLGCGEGKLIKALLREKYLEEILGVDVSTRTLEIAAKRLHLDNMSPSARPQIRLLHGALTYRDERLQEFDAAVLMEVIEHIEPDRLPALENSVFEFAKPNAVIITTPNAEYNELYPLLAAGAFRHSDHRFEWTRAEFQEWGARVAEQHGYSVEFGGVGPADDTYGSPSQMAVFTL